MAPARAASPGPMEPRICILQEAVGRHERCPGQTCPFWAGRECALDGFRADIEKDPKLAGRLLDLRGSAAGVEGWDPFRRLPRVRPFGERMGRAIITRGRIAPRPPTSRETAVMVVLELFIAIGAVFGGRALIQDAAGFGVKEAWLRFGVFSDYTIPGAILIVAVGGSMLVAALLALARRPIAFPAASIAGCALLFFLAVETAILGYHGARQLALLTMCAGTGLALMLLGRRGFR
jgi:hypothetical protein